MVNIAPQPLNNLQLELLRMYKTGVSDVQLLEIKKIISRYLLDKAMDEADKVWEQKKFDSITIQKWLNED